MLFRCHQESEKFFDYLCNRAVFSRPFHENFKFLKNCSYDFNEFLHSHSTPKGAPACAKASKSYGWDVRNIAKVCPKMAKKQKFLDFLNILKNCLYDSGEIFYSHSTPYYGPLCAIYDKNAQFMILCDVIKSIKHALDISPFPLVPRGSLGPLMYPSC